MNDISKIGASARNTDKHDADILGALPPLKAAGFGLHWLLSGSKAPAGNDGTGRSWSELPVASMEDLLRTHRGGYNLGVRLGAHSPVGGGYLHCIDLDIRQAGEAGEAMAALRDAFPGIDLGSLPTVASGSGGRSRHIYFVTDRPFASQRIDESGRYFVGDDGKRHATWEADLYGTGKHIVLPPSIHPITKKPYRWLIPPDFEMLALGLGYEIPSAVLDRISPNVPFTAQEIDKANMPCANLRHAQVRRWLGHLGEHRWSEYHYWFQIGAALHNQYLGAQKGLDLFEEISATKPNYEIGGTRAKWRSFGRNNRKKAVRFATIIQWAKVDLAERDAERLQGMFDDI